MNTRRIATVIIAMAAVSVIAMTGAFAVAQAKAGTHQHGQMGGMNMRQPGVAETTSEVWTC